MFNLIFNKSFSEETQEKIRSDFIEAKEYFSKYYDFSKKEIDIYFSDISRMKKEDISEILKIEKVSGLSMSGYGALIFEFFDTGYSKNIFLKLIFHELNHEFRCQTLPTPNNIWGDTILEGLALNFEKQAANELGYELKFLTDYYDKPDEDKLKWGLKRIIEITKNKEKINRYNWYFNHFGNDSSLPTNFVYRVGEFLISKYCEKYRIRPSDALKITNEEFEDFAKKEILCEK